MNQTQKDKQVRRFDARRGRLLIVDGVRWKWVVGRQFVTAHCEDGSRRVQYADVVVGSDFERGQRKRSSDGMVTPVLVAEWLRKPAQQPL